MKMSRRRLSLREWCGDDLQTWQSQHQIHWQRRLDWQHPLSRADPGRSMAILESKIGPNELHLYTNPNGEHDDFLQCVKSRKDPYFPVELGTASPPSVTGQSCHQARTRTEGGSREGTIHRRRCGKCGARPQATRSLATPGSLTERVVKFGGRKMNSRLNATTVNSKQAKDLAVRQNREGWKI
jgi:hypothetical protein